MKIIIAGAGNVGTHLAKLLSREKQDIILMDDDEEKLKCPQRQLRFVDCHGFSFFHLGTERGRRERSGLVHRSHPRRKPEYDCLYASHQSGCQKTVARIDNYEYLLPKTRNSSGNWV